jgi:hypothetical protein
MTQLKGFFEFELRAGEMTFLATVEFVPPGLEASEAKAQALELWTLHFAASEAIPSGAVECVGLNPVAEKPADALKVPKGQLPVLIWKSVEKT